MLRVSALRFRSHFSLPKRRMFSTSASWGMNLPPETELYEQTNGRWLFNEAQQQEIRRVNFNVSELIRVACAAAGAGSCLSIQKIAEGSFNKIFRLRFDNSKSLIARLPSSRMFGSGVSWAIASEVATMTIAREKLNVHTRRVVAWSKESDTSKEPVGWPYVLMEDVDGVLLDKEWLMSEMRGAPVAELLTQVGNDMHRMTVAPFSQLGSLYFPADLPSAPPLAAPMVLEDQVRVGPIADPLWWRSYHDEPHLDRGLWDTLEDYINAASATAKTPPLCPTQSHQLKTLSKSTVFSTRSQHWHPIFSKLSNVPLLSQHDSCRMSSYILTSALKMVPKLTAENSETRMEDPVFIDWQGTTVLPLALQWCVPPLAEYEPRLFQQDGRPVLEVRGISEVEWPSDIDELDPSEQEVVRAEHRIATRNVRWIQHFLSVQTYAHLFAFPLQRYLHILTQGILRACADGPHTLRFLLVHMKTAWDEDSESLALVPTHLSQMRPKGTRKGRNGWNGLMLHSHDWLCAFDVPETAVWSQRTMKPLCEN
ncbi:unnamed protein product [Cyclocybe aegerita]|uniref:Altered inheritance of mitochondria protein 9, mitochondrial n=1 Tax=Cyclocybe aegerita TaxID=1973307 RepID=A0A8S0X375_CYCAE|nr:unnamed protein product [Cyclocybe aegerita]